MLKEILLKIGFDIEMTTTSGNEKMSPNLAAQLTLSVTIDLARLTPYQRWNRSGFSRPDPTGKFQSHRRLTGRSTGFFIKGFCSLFNLRI